MLEYDGQVVHGALPFTVLYVPSLQAVHVLALGPVKPGLQIQAVMAELELGEVEPVGQFVHTVAPATEYDPAVQVVHDALPVIFLYFPVTHATHEPPFGPLKPALQAQAAIAELETGEIELEGQLEHVDTPAAEYFPVAQAVHTAEPAMENDPAVQVVHDALPVMSLYFPSTHATHEPPFGPLKPVLQAQAATAELETGEIELEGQLEHVDTPAAEYFPAPQAVHTAEPAMEKDPAVQVVHDALPVMSLYFPSTHATHEPPFGPEKPVLQAQAAIAELETGEIELEGQFEHVPTPAAEYFPAPQAVHTVEPATEKDPAVQVVHDALPVVFLYAPPEHATHEPPFGPEKPALQMQAAIAELEAGDIEFEGQIGHVDTPAPEYDPAKQSVHDALPNALYFPAAHAAKHVSPLGHVVSVRSTPLSMASAIAVMASPVMYSSTKKKPAMSASKPL